MRHSWELNLLCWVSGSKAVAHICFVFLRNFAKLTENTCARVSFLIKFFKKETLVQVFYSEFCKVSKSAFSTEHLRWLLLGFILVASIVVTLVSWFSGHKYKLEAKDFIFHILQINFPNVCVTILALWSAKSIRSFYFSLSCSQLIYTCSKFG